VQPIRFVFGLHLHQPVGNFDHVFQQHLNDVYQPLLDHLERGGLLPAVLHLSGPLLEWLEHHAPRYLDQLGRLAADGRLELLLAGFYEPVLASLPREDRVEQIGWLREALRRRLGAEATGLWLTERVWEPELAADLADAGVQYVLVDDRHFLVTGFRSEQLHAPYWTDAGGKRVALFPIDERLRYLIPFRPPEETASYLRELREQGHRLAVLADDGEKFGGWPGTKDWVYQRGWLDQFMASIRGLVERGEVRVSTFAEALREVPSAGLAYLPTASYREMESWSLPPDAALRLTRLERELGEQRINGPDGALVRGAHWRNFLVKYSESNWMHKKMLALSALCRRAGNPPEARRAIGRAQCNDAYWHGVFGGLYLPHLREAIWRNLSEAEGRLRSGEPLTWEAVDLDGDGHEEIWVHSGRFSAVVSPRRGGAIEEYTVFRTGINYAATLTRRLEAYHVTAVERHEAALQGGDGTPSIHDLEEGIHLEEQPPVDLDERAIFVDRVLTAGVSLESYARGEYQPVRSWGRVSTVWQAEQSGDVVEIRCALPGPGLLEKTLRFSTDGRIEVRYAWEAALGGGEDLFAPELSLFRRLEINCDPEADVWVHPVETVAKSERGLDRTLQGESVTLRWPLALGAARAEIRAPG
jgi:hypothetical protein